MGKMIKNILKQFFCRKGRFFPPYFWATLFLLCAAIQTVSETVSGVIQLVTEGVSGIGLWDTLGILGLTFAWMGVYKFADKSKNESASITEEE